MSWLNPSAVITQWRDQIILCPAVIALGIDATRVHYPQLDIAGGDALPCVKIVEASQTRERYAEGSIGLIQGLLGAFFYLDLTSMPSAGAVETFSRQLELELMSQYYGFAFRNITTTLSSDPTPGQRAAGEETPDLTFYGVSVAAQYGLDRR